MSRLDASATRRRFDQMADAWKHGIPAKEGMLCCLTRDADRLPRLTKVIGYLLGREHAANFAGRQFFSPEENQMLLSIVAGAAPLPETHASAVFALFIRLAIFDANNRTGEYDA